ncbi:MAG: TIR domain-containing protein [Candidatus Lokiarchaeota archaeon]|nr:TIR domain-containing protein [Candidatus Lokiarchaeota archaeon]
MVNIFLSYSTKDAEYFKISDIAEQLELYSEIDEVYYWQEHLHDNISKYMNDYMEKSEVMILFCSKNSKNSHSVEDEWTTHDHHKKPIIPIFENLEDVPYKLQKNFGCEFTSLNFDNFIKKLYSIILKKINLDSVIKEKNQYNDLKNEIVYYHGVKIYQIEAEVLLEIEQKIGCQFTLLNESEDDVEKLEFEVEDNHVVELNIQHWEIETLPINFGDLVELKELYLSDNELFELPKSIEKIISLEILNISNNQIDNLPINIGNLISLKELIVCYNNIKIIPDEIRDLSSLTRLDLSDNKIEYIPESIGNLSLLSRIDLSYNNLNSLPENIGELKNLKILNLAGNNLSFLPESFKNLINIEYINLNLNFLSYLPETIGELKNLKILSLADNKLSYLPMGIGNLSSLYGLNLGHNIHIRNLPRSIENLKNLEILILSQNPNLLLPSYLQKNTSLEEIDISDCGYRKIPKLLEPLDRRGVKILI